MTPETNEGRVDTHFSDLVFLITLCKSRKNNCAGLSTWHSSEAFLILKYLLMHDLYKEKLSLLLLMANNSVHQVARNSKIFLLLPYFCLAYLTRYLDILGFMHFYPPGRAGNGAMWVWAALRGSFSWAKQKTKYCGASLTSVVLWEQGKCGGLTCASPTHCSLVCVLGQAHCQKNLAQFLNMS